MRYGVIIISGLLALSACGPASPIEVLIPDTPAVCEEGPALTSLEITPQAQAIAEQANHMLHDGEHIWILESGANTVSRFRPSDGRFQPAFVDLGNDRGPYDFVIDAGQGFVTNYLSNTVSIYDTTSGEVVRELDDSRLVDPSGVAVTERHLYVSNVEYLGPDRGWGEGSIVVFERETFEVIDVIATHAPNPQYITTLDPGSEDEPGQIAIVSTGALGLVDGRYVQTSMAAVELWTESDDPIAPAREVFELPPPPAGSRVGGPGRALVSPDGASLYMTSATAPVIFELDLEQRAWSHGADAPLVLYEDDSDTLHSGVLDAHGLLWITSFNQDAIYVWDTSCDALLAGPIPVGVADEELEGPIAITSLPATGQGNDSQDVIQPEVYFITSLSKQLGTIEGI